MQTSSMKLTSRFVVAVAIIALQLTNVGAATAQAVRAEAKLPFCQSIGAIAIRMESDIESKKMPQYNKISDLRPQLDSKRAEADTMRASHYTKLIKKYDTPKQAQAIAEYKQTIRGAVAKRRMAVDAARRDFKDAANALQATHHQVVAQAEQNLQSSIEASIATAKTDCSSGGSSEQARNTFKLALEQARTQFQTTVKTQPNQQQALDLLITTRKQAIELAVAEFGQTAYDAKEKLLLALSQ